jgi:mRNA (2'-O-methyladenosine-N6-)-methyltransferase
MSVRTPSSCIELTDEVRYLHFQVVHTTAPPPTSAPQRTTISRIIADKLIPNPDGYVPPEVPQWINCDIRSFDYSVLGQYVPP